MVDEVDTELARALLEPGLARGRGRSLRSARRRTRDRGYRCNAQREHCGSHEQAGRPQPTAHRAHRRDAAPAPAAVSRTSIVRLATIGPGTVCRAPEGQRTSMLSTVFTPSNPK